MWSSLLPQSSKKVVLEEFLHGEELSYFIIVDKNSYKFFGSAQDHKKVGEGDKGLNTGGMGAYSPTPLLTKKLDNKIKCIFPGTIDSGKFSFRASFTEVNRWNDTLDSKREVKSITSSLETI